MNHPDPADLEPAPRKPGRWSLVLLAAIAVSTAALMVWAPGGSGGLIALLWAALLVVTSVSLIRVARWRAQRVRFRLMISYALLGVVPPVLLSFLAMISLYVFLAAQQMTAVRQAALTEIDAAQRLIRDLGAAHQPGAPLPPVHGMSLGWIDGDLAPEGQPRVRVHEVPGAAPELVLRVGIDARRAIEARAELESGLLERLSAATGREVSLVLLRGDASDAAEGDQETSVGVEFNERGLTLQSLSGEQVHAEVNLRWRELPILYVTNTHRLVGGPSDVSGLVLIEDSVSALAARLAEHQGLPIGAIVAGLLGAFALAEALLIAFSMWVGHRVGRSTDRLEEAARRIAAGDFAVRLPAGSRDQLGALALSFNAMARDLDQLVSEKVEAQRIEGEIAACATIQEGLLPAPDAELDGLRLAAYSRPARDVGGDAYDYFSLPGGRVALVVADVSGKGVTAALYMAELKGLMMAMADGRRAPAEVVRAVDAALRRTIRRGSFVTLAYVEIDPASGRGELVRAGHPAPLLAGPRGVREIDAEGSALGLAMIPDPVQGVGRFSLAEDECLVLYTDGLAEATDRQGKEMAEGPLLRAATDAARAAPGRPRAMRARLLEELGSHPGRRDDVTVLVAARGG